MYDEKFAKLVHRLTKNSQERQEFLNGKVVAEVPCNAHAQSALTKIFSQHDRISTDSVAIIGPTDFWA